MRFITPKPWHFALSGWNLDLVADHDFLPLKDD